MSEEARKLLAEEYERAFLDQRAADLVRSGEEGLFSGRELCALRAIERALSTPPPTIEGVEAAFREAYQLGFLEGYEIEPRCDLSDAEGRKTALQQLEGVSEAWSDYSASIPRERVDRDGVLEEAALVCERSKIGPAPPNSDQLTQIMHRRINELLEMIAKAIRSLKDRDGGKI